MTTAAADLLDEVNEAISACLTSQAYTARGRSQRRAQLRELFDARRELIREINEAAANAGSMSTVGKVLRPR